MATDSENSLCESLIPVSNDETGDMESTRAVRWVLNIILSVSSSKKIKSTRMNWSMLLAEGFSITNAFAVLWESAISILQNPSQCKDSGAMVMYYSLIWHYRHVLTFWNSMTTLYSTRYRLLKFKNRRCHHIYLINLHLTFIQIWMYNQWTTFIFSSQLHDPVDCVVIPGGAIKSDSHVSLTLSPSLLCSTPSSALYHHICTRQVWIPPVFYKCKKFIWSSSGNSGAVCAVNTS